MKLDKTIIDKLLLLPLQKHIGASLENRIEVYQCRLVEGLNFQCWVAACDKEGMPLENGQLSLFLYAGGIKGVIITTVEQVYKSAEHELIRMIRNCLRPDHPAYVEANLNVIPG